jgi:hypothetical protein
VEKLLALGSYPDTPLQKARAKRDAARLMLADGGDPGAKRKAEKHAQTDTFAAVAEEWLETKRATLTDRARSLRKAQSATRPLQIRAGLASCSGRLTATTGREPRLPPLRFSGDRSTATTTK